MVYPGGERLVSVAEDPVGELVEHVNPPSVSPPKGEYTHAVVLDVSAAKLCFVTGQVGYSLDGRAATGFDQQVDYAFDNLRTVLESVGASFATVVQLTTYLTSDALIDRYFAKRAELFPQLFGARYPANALIIVSALARPELQIEVQAIAAIPGS
jgi:2-iminobutanoate/2-iminopropanoate deaminase